MASKPKRAINEGPLSPAAQARRLLYDKTMARIDEAMDSGFMIEAVALLESVIADRLESRYAYINQQEADKRTFRTLKQLTEPLKGKNSSESVEAKSIYMRIESWAEQRNTVLHEFAKHADDSRLTWDCKYARANTTAEHGLALFRELDNLVRRLKRQQEKLDG